MAKTPAEPQAPDLLAAVVLDVLVRAGPAGLALREITRACERNPRNPEEAREVEIAANILVADELATREADLYRPTRAAIRAAELSF